MIDLLKWLAQKPGNRRDSDPLGRRIDRMRSKGRTDDATTLLSDVLSNRPDDWYPWYLLGTVYLDAWDWEQAGEAYMKALELNPEDMRLKVSVAQFLIGSGQPEPAVKFLEEAVQLWPESSEAHSNLGMAYLRLEELDLAEREFEISMRLSEVNPDAREGISEIYSRTNRLDKVDRVLRDYVKQAPDLASSHSFLADHLVNAHGDCRTAVKSYELALRLFQRKNKPGWFKQYFSTADYPHKIIANYLRALVDCGHDSSARSVARDELGTGELEAFEAMLLEDEGRYQQARRKLTRATKHDHTAHHWISQLGRVHLALGDFEYAEDAFKKAIAISQAQGDTDPWYRGGLIVCLEAQGKFSEGDSIEVAVEESEARRLMRSLGYHYALIGEFDRAVEAYERVLVVDPSDHWTAQSMAKVLLESSRHQQAIAVLRQLIKEQPANPRNYLLLGDALEAAGNGGSAIGVLREAIDADRLSVPLVRRAKNRIKQLEAK